MVASAERKAWWVHVGRSREGHGDGDGAVLWWPGNGDGDGGARRTLKYLLNPWSSVIPGVDAFGNYCARAFSVSGGFFSVRSHACGESGDRAPVARLHWAATGLEVSNGSKLSQSGAFRD